MILVGRLGAAEPILGNLWELDAIAAAAIGGASLMGGKGSDHRHDPRRDHPRRDAQRPDADERPGLLSTPGHWTYYPCRDADRSRHEGTRMNFDKRSKAVGPRIRMMMPSSPRSEARVVDTVFGLRDFEEATALKDFAAEAGVSEAMVVKITKKLGFAGFRDFRSASPLQQAADGRDASGTIARRQSTPRSSRRSSGRRSMRLRRRWRSWISTPSIAPPTAAPAGTATSTVSAARPRSPAMSHTIPADRRSRQCFDDAHMMLMSASLLGPRRRDRLFAFRPTDRRDRGDAASPRRGARTIAITNYARRRWLDRRHRPVFTAQGSPLMGENAAARIAQLNILDALFVAVAQRDYQAAERISKGRCPAVQRQAGFHEPCAASPRRRLRQPALRHHGPRARPAAQGRDRARRRLDPKCGGKGGNQAVSAAKTGGDGRWSARSAMMTSAMRCWQPRRDRVDQSSRGPGAVGMSVAIFDTEGDYGAVIVSGSNRASAMT